METMQLSQSENSSTELRNSLDSVVLLKKLIESKQYEPALDIYHQMDMKSKMDIDLQMTVYEIYENLNDYPKALRCLHNVCDQLKDNDPLFFDIYKAMGNIYLKCGDIDSAEEKYNLAYGIDSEDEALSVNYGVLSIQKGDYSQAKERFSKVISVNSASDVAWVGLALVHRSFSDSELSRACLLRALDENPLNRLAVQNIYSWSEQDGVEISEEILANYLEANPDDSELSELAMKRRQ